MGSIAHGALRDIVKDKRLLEKVKCYIYLNFKCVNDFLMETYDFCVQYNDTYTRVLYVYNYN